MENSVTKKVQAEGKYLERRVADDPEDLPGYVRKVRKYQTQRQAAETVGVKVGMIVGPYLVRQWERSQAARETDNASS